MAEKASVDCVCVWEREIAKKGAGSMNGYIFLDSAWLHMKYGDMGSFWGW